MLGTSSGLRWLAAALLVSGSSCGPQSDENPLSPGAPLLPSGRVAAVEVFPTSAELLLSPPENTVNVYAIVRNAEGRPMMGRDPSFSSDNPAVASVDSTGKVTARSVGTAGITVTIPNGDDPKSATARIDVLGPPVAVELAFETSPGPASAGLELDPVRIATRDARGRTVASFEGRVDLSLIAGSDTSSFYLGTGRAVGGIVTFSGLRIRDAGEYRLRATSEGLPAAMGASFEVAPAPSGRIAFVSDREGTPKIYVINADGSGIRRVTSGAGADSRPAWSPDGRRIAFARAGDSGSCGIYVIGADGSGLERLTTACGDITPAWSPDGGRIAFGKWTLGSLATGIYVMNADGSGVTRLTESLQDEYPAWSPDGRRIAFNHTTEDDNGWFTQVYVMNADGTDSRRLTFTGSSQFAESGPSWSPDGSKIVFWSFGAGIATVPGGGGAPSPLYNGVDDPYEHGDLNYYSTPDWSPDGSKVVLARGNLGQRKLAIANASGGGRLQGLTTGSSSYEDYEPTWIGGEQ